MPNFRTETIYKTIKILFVSLTLILFITSLFLPREIFAGSGYIDEGNIYKDGEGNIVVEEPHKLNLNLLFEYDVDYGVLDIWEEAFNRASKLLYNSTEGQMRIGTVNVYVKYEQDTVDPDIIVFNEEHGIASATVAKVTEDHGLDGLGYISLFKNHKYESDEMELQSNFLFEGHYGQVWIPNTPDGFGTFYTYDKDEPEDSPEDHFPDFDNLVGKKTKLESGHQVISLEKYTDGYFHWRWGDLGRWYINGIDHIRFIYDTEDYPYPITDDIDGWNHIYCPDIPPFYSYMYGFSDIKDMAVVLMAIKEEDESSKKGRYVLYIAQKTNGGDTIYNRFYEETEVAMDVHYSYDGKGSISIVHELGHYVFGLWDEYKSILVDENRDPLKDDQGRYIEKNVGFCTSINPGDPACLMDAGYNVNIQRTEWCTPAGTDLITAHNDELHIDGEDLYLTVQEALNKESCWETIVRFCHDKYGVDFILPEGELSTELPDGYEDVIWNLKNSPFRLVIAIDKSASMVLENINDDEETEALRDSYDQIWIPNTPDGFGTFYTYDGDDPEDSPEEHFPAFDDLIDKKEEFQSGTVTLSFGKKDDDDMHWIVDGWRLVDTPIDNSKLLKAKVPYNGSYGYVYSPMTGNPYYEYGFDDTEEAAVVLMAIKEESEENGKYVQYIARKNYAGETKYDQLYIPTQLEVVMAVHEKKMDLAKWGASHFINLINATDRLGIVSFSSSPSIDFPLLKMTESSMELSALLAINASSDCDATDITAALQASLNQIESGGGYSPGECIILLSDGRDNAGGDIGIVIEACHNRGVKVYTIGLGADVNEEILKDIANGTEGKYWFAENKEEFLGIYHYISNKKAELDYTGRFEENISASEQIIKSIYVDTYNNEAYFEISWEDGDLDLTLQGPDGSVVDPAAAQSNSNIEFIEGEDYEFYSIKNPMAGDWQLIVDAVDVSGEETFTLDVSSESEEVEFDVSTDKESYTYPEEIKIEAGVMAIYPVANAEVTGTVERPDGSTVDITLFDDGLESHGDGAADDGFYSNYFDEYTEDGLYTFNIIVENEEGVPASGESEVPPEGWTSQPIYPFVREASVSVTVSEIPQESPTELAFEFPTTIQYSDMLSGKATLTSEDTPLENKEVEFGCMLPTETLTTDESGEVYSTPYMVEEASGTENYTVCANFYGDDNYLSSYAEEYITVEKEDATLTYNGDTSVIALNPINLSVNVTEEEDGSLGDITLAGPVTFDIYDGETLLDTYSADIVDSSAGITIDGLEEGLYTVEISLQDSNQYYQADSILIDLEVTQ